MAREDTCVIADHRLVSPWPFEIQPEQVDDPQNYIRKNTPALEYLCVWPRWNRPERAFWETNSWETNSWKTNSWKTNSWETTSWKTTREALGVSVTVARWLPRGLGSLVFWLRLCCGLLLTGVSTLFLVGNLLGNPSGMP